MKFNDTDKWATTKLSECGRYAVQARKLSGLNGAWFYGVWQQASGKDKYGKPWQGWKHKATFSSAKEAYDWCDHDLEAQRRPQELETV